MDGSPRTSRLIHPLLRLEVVHPDGTRTISHRVFCRLERRSEPVETCCACVHCESVGSDPFPSVVCSVPLDAEELDDGDFTEVGAVLREGTVALADDRGALVGVTDEVGGRARPTLVLHEATPVRRALCLLAAGQLHEATVVDDDGVPLGVFREIDGVRFLRLARTRTA